jgi:DeoR/GlpR family transcriptional regulator of sugar metabolism
MKARDAGGSGSQNQEREKGASSKDEVGALFGKGVGERGAYILRKIEQESASKKAVARHVAEHHVSDFDAVLLDAGSTAELVAEALFTRRKYLSVMTINLGAYAAYTRAIAPHVGRSQLVTDMGRPGAGLLNENELLIPGGRYVATYEALFGDRTLEAIKTFSPNVTIIGVSGLRFEGGVFCHGAEEVQVKRLLWTIPTDTRLIAADWTKIGRRDAHPFGQSLDQLGVGASKAVVVTSKPPRSAAAESRKEFDEQIRSMRRTNIVVEIIDPEEPSADA